MLRAVLVLVLVLTATGAQAASKKTETRKAESKKTEDAPSPALKQRIAALSVIDDDEVCTGHRSQPFPELDTPADKS